MGISRVIYLVQSVGHLVWVSSGRHALHWKARTRRGRTKRVEVLKRRMWVFVQKGKTTSERALASNETDQKRWPVDIITMAQPEIGHGLGWRAPCWRHCAKTKTLTYPHPKSRALLLVPVHVCLGFWPSATKMTSKRFHRGKDGQKGGSKHTKSNMTIEGLGPNI